MEEEMFKEMMDNTKISAGMERYWLIFKFRR